MKKNLPMTYHLADFAELVRSYQGWALAPAGTETESARLALGHFLDLYHGALLLLPLPDPPEETNTQETVDEGEWKRVYELAGNLPVNYYSAISQPLVVPADEPVVADLAEDTADVFRDLVEGLRLYDDGEYSQAHWQWVFSMPHWGEHATSAIRVLHAFLSDRDFFLG
jgi:hypothetical protein